MLKYLIVATGVAKRLNEVGIDLVFKKISRESNQEADMLFKMAYEGYGLPRGVLLEELKEPTLEANQNMLVIEATYWMKPIVE